MDDGRWAVGILIIAAIVWGFWPESSHYRTVTVHEYACVVYHDAGWNIAAYKHGTCSGLEKNITDGTVKFRVWPDSQRVIAELPGNVVDKLHSCIVFDKNNWECSSFNNATMTLWTMSDGYFEGPISSYQYPNLRYSGFLAWISHFSNGGAIKASSIRGL